MVLVLIYLWLVNTPLSAQKKLLIGVGGGWNYNTIVFDDRLPVTPEGSIHAGLLFTYLPGDKKPGFKLSLNRTELAFSELLDGEEHRYSQSGLEFHFLSHLFLRTTRTRFFIDLGPGISYLGTTKGQNPQDSILPTFVPDQLNKVHLLLTGGSGINQQIGSTYLSVYGQFSFDTVKVFQTLEGLSNALVLRIGGSLQWNIAR